MKNSVFYLVLISIVIMLGAMTCSPKLASKPNPKPITQTTSMNDYTAEWNAILELEKKGLIKSALEKVISLYARAKKEDNAPQVIKTILYREKYSSQLEEYGLENSIRAFQEEVTMLDGASKSLVHFMLGRSMANYLQANQWKFSDRTTSPTFKPESMETWSIQNFLDEINFHFGEALKDESIKTVSVKEYEVLLTEGKNTDSLRPSLYDFIAHQILDYYISPASYLVEPVYKFYLDDEKAFAPVEQFVNHNFTAQDSTSHLYQSVWHLQMPPYRTKDNCMSKHLARWKVNIRKVLIYCQLYFWHKLIFINKVKLT